MVVGVDAELDESSVDAKLKTESFHSGERFLPMRDISCVMALMSCYGLLACRQGFLWWNVPTALLSASSV